MHWQSQTSETGQPFNNNNNIGDDDDDEDDNTNDKGDNSNDDDSSNDLGSEDENLAIGDRSLDTSKMTSQAPAGGNELQQPQEQEMTSDSGVVSPTTEERTETITATPGHNESGPTPDDLDVIVRGFFKFQG